MERVNGQIATIAAISLRTLSTSPACAGLVMLERKKGAPGAPFQRHERCLRHACKLRKAFTGNSVNALRRHRGPQRLVCYSTQLPPDWKAIYLLTTLSRGRSRSTRDGPVQPKAGGKAETGNRL